MPSLTSGGLLATSRPQYANQNTALTLTLTLTLTLSRFRELEVSPETAEEALGAVDVLFAFSTCFDDVALAGMLAAGLRPGARVVTVDSMLPNRGDPAAAGVPRFRLLQRATICEHTAYVWELSDAPPALWIDYALLT